MRKRSRDEMTISQIILKWLLLIVSVAYFISAVAIWFLLTFITAKQSKEVLSQTISDVRQDISDASDANLRGLANLVRMYCDDKEQYLLDPTFLDYLEENGLDMTLQNYLKFLAWFYNLTEISIIGKDGVISESTNDLYIGFDMNSGKQSSEFMKLLREGDGTCVQAYGPITQNSEIFRKFAGAALQKTERYIQVSYDAEHFQNDIANDVDGITRNRHVDQTGCVLIADKNGIIVSGPKEMYGKMLTEIGFDVIHDDVEEYRLFSTVFRGEVCFCMYGVNEGYYIISVLPKQEFMQSRNVTVLALILFDFILFVIVYIGLYRLLKREVADNLRTVTKDLDEITSGKLDVVLQVGGNREFVTLSRDINEMVGSLKAYALAETKRIEQELEYAKNIQLSALPSVFPPYPERVSEFDIYADMKPAKEVGGDFYDFFMIGSDRLAILIADVSGKGIPAAMCMMRAKALLKSSSYSFGAPGDIFYEVNNLLCDGNARNMFLTCWMGILDLKTGEMEFANAGHNIPLLRHAGGEYEYLAEKTNFVLAGMEYVSYQTQHMKLEHGDELFLYTDGVPEATSASVELFGDERLKETLNSQLDRTSKEICSNVHTHVDMFVGAADQFDDMTTLSLRYF